MTESDPVFDTSALVKRYTDEAGTETVGQLVDLRLFDLSDIVATLESD